MMAQPGAHARDEFLRLERLHDVVVGAGLEAEDHVDRVGLRGQHDDRRAALRADRAAHVDPGHARQHEVEQHDVRLGLAERLQRARAVGHEDRLELIGAQHDAEHFGERGVIVDYEDAGFHVAHGVTSLLRNVCTRLLPAARRARWAARSGHATAGGGGDDRLGCSPAAPARPGHRCARSAWPRSSTGPCGSPAATRVPSSSSRCRTRSSRRRRPRWCSTGRSPRRTRPRVRRSALLLIAAGFGAILTGLLAPLYAGDLLGRPISIGESAAPGRPPRVPLLPRSGWPSSVCEGVGLGRSWSAACGSGACGRSPRRSLVAGAAGHRAAFADPMTLVTGTFWRVWGIRALGWLITYVLTQLILLPLTCSPCGRPGSTRWTPPATRTNAGVYVAILAGGQLIAAALLSPVTAAIDVLLYTDLRMRKEGMDIVLRLPARAATARRGGDGGLRVVSRAPGRSAAAPRATPRASELEHGEYHADDPGYTTRVLHWIGRHLADLFTGGTGGHALLIVLVALARRADRSSRSEPAGRAAAPARTAVDELDPLAPDPGARSPAYRATTCRRRPPRRGGARMAARGCRNHRGARRAPAAARPHRCGHRARSGPVAARLAATGLAERQPRVRRGLVRRSAGDRRRCARRTGGR